MKYTTQIDVARKEILTKEMEFVNLNWIYKSKFELSL
jgi:thiamine biosynthesis protein ThiC